MNALSSKSSQPEALLITPTRTRTVVVMALTCVLIFAAVLVLGVASRARQSRELAATTAQAANAPPRVEVVRPAASLPSVWTLPGTTQAIQDTVVYARVSGFISRRYVDMGDTVKAGQLLAEIESPEIDQQLAQARANLEQARKQLDLQRANLELARITLERNKEAEVDGAVAKIVVDQAVAAYATSQAAVAAAQATVDGNEATVRQFEAMAAFERVLAPFDGIVTQRNVDVGALITAGSPTNNTSVAPTNVSGAPTGLFEIAQIDTLRVFVNVPQVVAANITPGLAAQITVRGNQSAPVAATVTRTAKALDPGTRTLLTEVDIPNSSHALFPGQFVNVAITLTPSGQRWNIPASALIFNSTGTQVMLVDPDGKLRLQQVTVGRDFGDTIDVQSGLDGTEKIVFRPNVSQQSGQTVIPVASAPGR